MRGQSHRLARRRTTCTDNNTRVSDAGAPSRRAAQACSAMCYAVLQPAEAGSSTLEHQGPRSNATLGLALLDARSCVLINKGHPVRSRSHRGEESSLLHREGRRQSRLVPNLPTSSRQYSPPQHRRFALFQRCVVEIRITRALRSHWTETRASIPPPATLMYADAPSHAARCAQQFTFSLMPSPQPGPGPASSEGVVRGRAGGVLGG